jgi:hypothetical protein
MRAGEFVLRRPFVFSFKNDFFWAYAALPFLKQRHTLCYGAFFGRELLRPLPGRNGGNYPLFSVLRRLLAQKKTA